MGKENKVKNELFKALSSAKVQDNSISYTRIDCVDVVFINNNEKVEPLEFSKPNVTEFDSMQELVRSVTDEFVSNAGCDYKVSFAGCTGDFFENKEIKQESKMKHKNTEDYYNEQSKENKFAPSFDNLGASAKNYWEREFDEYARNNKAIELENGCAYQFDHGGKRISGVYKLSEKGFCHCFNDPNFQYGLAIRIVSPLTCTNIVKLVPEVK